jgi:hypothetical protein
MVPPFPHEANGLVGSMDPDGHEHKPEDNHDPKERTSLLIVFRRGSRGSE